MDFGALLWNIGTLIAGVAAVIAVNKRSLSQLEKSLDKLIVQYEKLGDQITEMAKENASALSEIKIATELNKHRIERLEGEVDRLRPRIHAMECTFGDPRRTGQAD